MNTLHEIAVDRATKQPGIVDSLTEEAPILAVCRWKPATHGLWNVAEKMTSIEGAKFLEPDAPLPMMNASSDLVTTDLQTLGGMMEVPSQRAWKFGGPGKYFAQKQPYLLKQAGMTTEKQIVEKVWLEAAIKNGNAHDAGGTANGWYILAVRFDELNNVGLYDADQFDQGRLLRITALYNGAEHHLSDPQYRKSLGYSVAYRGNFGWQLLDAKRCCAAIVNIDRTNHPTVEMIDEVLADIRAQPGSTYLFCAPKAKIYGIDPYKIQNVYLTNDNKDAKTRIETWNGISIITSHNIADRIAHVDETVSD